MAITIGMIVIGPGIGVGPGSVRDSARYLAGNDWLEIGNLDGRTSVTLGSRAGKLLEENHRRYMTRTGYSYGVFRIGTPSLAATSGMLVP